MLIFENIALAFAALVSNKMRSFLTMLGIIIGIGSVISIVTVGNSLSNSISSSMESMGANSISVGLMQKEDEEEENKEGPRFDEPGRYRQITNEDKFTSEMIEGLLAEFPDQIRAIGLESQIGRGGVSLGGEDASVVLVGHNADSLEMENLEMLAGSVISDKAQREGKSVAMVSDVFVDNMLRGDYQKAIGQEIEVRIGRDFYPLTIVGVYKYKQNALMATGMRSVETNVYVPEKYAELKLHEIGLYDHFSVYTQQGSDSSLISTNIKRYLNRWYHRNPYFEVETFNMESIVSQLTKMLSTVSTAISVIAGISLLVGGIGVMNIMMVSISERTREIGTRKALGATNASIRFQFIVEAMVLCLVGGVFGVILGIAGGALGAKLLGYEASASISSILISLGFSLAIGVFFGFYPANKAAKMNPIDALRYE